MHKRHELPLFPVSTTIWTVGHSTRSVEEFLNVLKAFAIELVVDVRRFPGSRRAPQFGQDALAAKLTANGMDYCWLPALGGRRRTTTLETSNGWRHSAFRAYADHMATEEFATGLMDLLMLASGRRTAVMCAEILWWRCHRRIIADVLVSLGYSVIHIREKDISDVHYLAPPARLIRGKLDYGATSNGAVDEAAIR